MAVNSLGYRSWNGALASAWHTPIVIAKTGVQRAWKSRWLRRLLLFAWLPALWFGAGFFLFEKSLTVPDVAQALRPYLETRVQVPQLTQAMEDIATGNPEAARHVVWSWLLLTFFRYPQGVLMTLVVGLVAPGLISQDIRSRAFLLYFSRPIGRREYVLGKLGTIVAYLVMISTLPALALYVVGVLLSPQFDVVSSTWDLPFRILAASCVLSIPTASLALCLSSTTQESRTAGFAWFAILVLGWVTYGVLSTVEQVSQAGRGDFSPLDGESYWALLSLYHTLGRVQGWVFGFHEFGDVIGSSIVLLLITLVSLVVLFRRVTAPMRA